jgi:hypothetical protein
MLDQFSNQSPSVFFYSVRNYFPTSIQIPQSSEVPSARSALAGQLRPERRGWLDNHGRAFDSRRTATCVSLGIANQSQTTDQPSDGETSRGLKRCSATRSFPQTKNNAKSIFIIQWNDSLLARGFCLEDSIIINNPIIVTTVQYKHLRCWVGVSVRYSVLLFHQARSFP